MAGQPVCCGGRGRVCSRTGLRLVAGKEHAEFRGEGPIVMVSGEHTHTGPMARVEATGAVLMRDVPAEADPAGLPSVSSWVVEVHEGPDAVHTLTDEWHALAVCCGQDIHFFQTPEWGLAWIRHGRGARQEVPVLVSVRDRAGRLVLLWPLMRTRFGPLRLLRWLSDPFSQYGDVLSRLHGAALQSALVASWRAIVDIANVDIIRLRHVRGDALVSDFLAARCRQAEAEGAPALDLSQIPDEAAYEARFDRRQRRRRRRIRRRLEAAFGPVTFHRITEPGALRQAVARLIEEKRKWLDARGLYSRPLKWPGLAQVFESVHALAGTLHDADANGEGPELVVTEMRAGERPVSWELGFRFRGRHYCYITAHDHALTDLSPGRLHMHLSQLQALKDGVRVFDLLVPAAPHKESWSDHVVAVRDHYLPLTLKGRLIGEGYLRIARPLARQLYLAAPDSLRHLAARLLRGSPPPRG